MGNNANDLNFDDTDFNIGSDTIDDDFNTMTADGGFNDDSDFDFGDDIGTSAGTDTDSNQFNNSINNLDSQNQYQDSSSEKHALTRQSIIMIVAGVALIFIIMLIASIISKKTSSNSEKASTDIELTESTVSQSTEQSNSNVNVDNIMSNDTSTSNNANSNQQSIITNKVDDDFVWTIITDSENVQFNSEYTDSIFTVTGIEHKARVLDTNNNLVVITTLHGSISGLSGTFELDIPYNKGVKLVVGNSFTVHVQLGTYNGKTVVGEIKY